MQKLFEFLKSWVKNQALGSEPSSIEVTAGTLPSAILVNPPKPKATEVSENG